MAQVLTQVNLVVVQLVDLQLSHLAPVVAVQHKLQVALELVQMAMDHLVKEDKDIMQAQDMLVLVVVAGMVAVAHNQMAQVMMIVAVEAVQAMSIHQQQQQTIHQAVY